MSSGSASERDDDSHPGHLLAVALGPRTPSEALDLLRRAAQVADAVELRLDYLDDLTSLEMLIQARACLLVATLRGVAQGGRSSLSATERVEILVRAADAGAAYVDLDCDAASPEHVARLKSAGAGVIVSRHDFQQMPDDLGAWWRELADAGADVVKVVGTAQDARDCLPVFQVLRAASLPTVALAMGAAGLPSRVLSLTYPRCFLTFAALDEGTGTAPGQVTVQEMRQAYHVARLGPSTLPYGLLGPHAESALAARHNAWFAAAGVDGVAVPVPAERDAGAIVQAYRSVPWGGWHIHGASLQRDVLPVLDELDASARAQGKVNGITVRAGALVGAWVESPEEQFALWTGQAPRSD